MPCPICESSAFPVAVGTKGDRAYCPDCFAPRSSLSKSVPVGVKHDGNKPMMDLLAPRWVVGVSQVLTFGAKKYNAHNWRAGLAVSRLVASSLRHTFAFLGGEDLDPESGLSHLYHASCGLMMASEMMLTKPELDDRYKESK